MLRRRRFVQRFPRKGVVFYPLFYERRGILLNEEKLYAGKLPVLALRGLTVFPDQTVHFDVGRAKSVLALEAAMKADQTLFLVPQKDLLVDDPKLADLYSIGTVAKVKQVLKTQTENLRVLVTGICRGRITELS